MQTTRSELKKVAALPLALVGFLFLSAASAGITTRQALTAAPGAVALGGVAASEGSSTSFARADHVHSISGTVPQGNGGTGAGALTCTSIQGLTSNGTLYSCQTFPGQGSTGSAVPSTAQYLGGKDNAGNLQGVIVCDKSVAIVGTALNGSLKIVTGVSTKKVYVCGGFVIISAAVNLKFIEGTGTNCATGPSDVTGATPLAANGGYTLGLAGFASPFTNTATDDLCINTSGAATVGGWLSYTFK